MGVLIIIGTAVVIGTIIHRIYARNSVPAPMAAPLAAPLAPATPPSGQPMQLRPGEQIAGISQAGADLAILVTGPAGDRLLLLNPATGRISIILEGTGIAQNDARGGLNK